MMVKHAFGHVTPMARRIVLERDWGKLKWNARLFLGLYVLLIAASVLLGSFWPIILLFLPRFFGAWLRETMVTMQHPGLAEDQ